MNSKTGISAVVTAVALTLSVVGFGLGCAPEAIPTRSGTGGTTVAGTGGATTSSSGGSTVTTGSGGVTVSGSGGATSSSGGATVSGSGGATSGSGGATSGSGGATSGSGGATSGSGGATSGSGGATSTGSGGITGTVAACTTQTKGGMCVSATDVCAKACGPDKKGAKLETCTNAAYVEGTCDFPAADYACYKVTATTAACPAGTTTSGAMNACTAAACTACSGYSDSMGAAKVGFCVCTGGKWSCGSDKEWPCKTNGTPTTAGGTGC
jgi:hypothetical protein